MLKLGRKFTINSHNSPPIALDLGAIGPLIDHRFQRDRQARAQQHARPGSPKFGS